MDNQNKKKERKPELIRTVQPGDIIRLQFNRNGELWFLPIIKEYDEKENKEIPRNNMGR